MRFLFLFTGLVFLMAVPARAQDVLPPIPRSEMPSADPQEGREPVREYTPYQAAPKTDGKSDFVSGPQYMALAYAAIRNRPHDFDFGTFRLYYTLTDQYDPIGEEAGEQLVNFAFTADSAPKPEERTKAFEDYGNHLVRHLANVDVVTRALLLSRQNPIFGDPGFFEWIRNGLMQDALNSGDGKTLTGAYDIMTMGEETLLFSFLRVRLLESQSEQSGRIHYNMHKVQNMLQPSEVYWIFTDVTRPLEALELQQSRRGVQLSIPAQ